MTQIVWSEEKKKWVNIVDGDGETENVIKPPPKVSELSNYKSVESTAVNQMMSIPSSNNNIPAPNLPPSGGVADSNKPNIPMSGSSSTNMYKMSRGKG